MRLIASDHLSPAASSTLSAGARAAPRDAWLQDRSGLSAGCQLLVKWQVAWTRESPRSGLLPLGIMAWTS